LVARHEASAGAPRVLANGHVVFVEFRGEFARRLLGGLARRDRSRRIVPRLWRHRRLLSAVRRHLAGGRNFAAGPVAEAEAHDGLARLTLSMHSILSRASAVLHKRASREVAIFMRNPA